MLLIKNTTFPYVTMPHFDKRGAGLLELVGASYVGFIPIIKGSQRAEWEAWSVQKNADWIPEIYRPPGDISVSPTIFRLADNQRLADPVPLESTPDQTLYPVWQIAPPIAGLVNVDILQTFPYIATAVEELLEDGQPKLSPPAEDNTLVADPDGPATWPSSFMLAPVFDDLDGNGSIVALLASVVPWAKFFQNILPDGTKAMDVVIQSTCGAALTYKVTGQTVTPVGKCDCHDPSFDHLEIVAEEESASSSTAVLNSNNNDEDNNNGILAKDRQHVWPSVQILRQLDASDEQSLMNQLGYLPGNALQAAARADAIPGLDPNHPTAPIVLRLYPIVVRDETDGKRKHHKPRVRKQQQPPPPPINNGEETTCSTTHDDTRHHLLEPFPTIYWVTHPRLRALISKLELDQLGVALEKKLKEDAVAMEQMKRAHWLDILTRTGGT
jgi:hypothetical protein